MKHYQESLSNFKSLIKQTFYVGLGFVVMLLLTCGKPTPLVLGITVGLSIVFVFYDELKRLK